ncbi:MAG: regulatory protein RecX [Lachnospiraceae bacterium]|nr:regulatory protein RecX [Lachnospiraceae bacterium]
MLIREILPCRNSKQRSRVCLEDGTGFILYKKEIYHYELAEGKELSEDVYEKILKEVMIPRARKRAMHLLEEQDRTRAELSERLKTAGYLPEAIEDALSYVESFHYIDDERYARNYIRFHQENKSRRRLSQDLKKKGLSDDLIRLAMEEENETDPKEQIRNLLLKKHFDLSNPDYQTRRKEEARACRFLASRGFEMSDIIDQVRAFSEQNLD